MTQNKKQTSNLDVAQFSEKDFPSVVKGIAEPTDQEHLEVEYDLKAEEVKSGLKRFQKEYGKVRKIVYTILCAMILVIQLTDLFWRGNTSALTYLLIAAALAVIFIVWFNPKFHRDKIAKAMDQQPMKFTMCFYPECIFIREQQGGTRIFYSDPSNKCIEDPEKFIICVGKERIYLLPKRCLSDEQYAKVKKYLKNMQDRLISEA